MRRLLRLTLNLCLAWAIVLSATPAWAADQIYIVQPGDTLFRIATRYGITVPALQAANGLTSNLIYSGQTLVIPGGNAPAPQPPAAPPESTGGSETRPNTPALTHIVQRGETLFLIGLKYGLQWTAIQQANNLATTTVYAGQTLIIPGRAPAVTPPPAATPVPVTTTPAPTETPAPESTGESETRPDVTATEAAPPAPSITHIVQRGETLFLIGLKYGLAWTTIQQANNLAGTTVYVGQELIIPNGSGLPANTTPTDPLAGVVVPIPPPASSPDERRFLVDLSDQRLYAFEGDTMVRTTLISSGLPRTPTVIGTYSIYLRYASARMRGEGYDLANVPFVMYFYQSYGLHGTYWHNNFGQPMSHGCVNMPTDEAEWAYNWSTYGTKVIVQP